MRCRDREEAMSIEALAALQAISVAGPLNITDPAVRAELVDGEYIKKHGGAFRLTDRGRRVVIDNLIGRYPWLAPVR